MLERDLYAGSIPRNASTNPYDCLAVASHEQEIYISGPAHNSATASPLCLCIASAGYSMLARTSAIYPLQRSDEK